MSRISEVEKLLLSFFDHADPVGDGARARPRNQVAETTLPGSVDVLAEPKEIPPLPALSTDRPS
ncbi:MAG: hypothetical protein HY717_16965 [Planctomycetes bacterium]|nr:hypothetical protein [Planctomycetota bacterium]